MLAQRQVDGFITIFGFDYAVAQTLQLQSHEVTRVIAVLDEQDCQVCGSFINHCFFRLSSIQLRYHFFGIQSSCPASGPELAGEVKISALKNFERTTGPLLSLEC